MAKKPKHTTVASAEEERDQARKEFAGAVQMDQMTSLVRGPGISSVDAILLTLVEWITSNDDPIAALETEARFWRSAARKMQR